MSKFSALLSITLLSVTAWLGYAIYALEQHKALNQDILVQAALPICAAPTPTENSDPQVEHADTKEIA